MPSPFREFFKKEGLARRGNAKYGLSLLCHSRTGEERVSVAPQDLFQIFQREANKKAEKVYCACKAGIQSLTILNLKFSNSVISN